MATALRTPCRQRGCPRAGAEGGYCAEHAKARQQQQDRERGSASERGYGWRWQRYRAAYLAKHPLCIRCEAEGRLTPATVVDHITPHRGDQKLFWDVSNLAALCKPHHDAKTAREDGGFGNWTPRPRR